MLFLKGIGLSIGKYFFKPLAFIIGSVTVYPPFYALIGYPLFGNDKQQNDQALLQSFRDFSFYKYPPHRYNGQQMDTLVYHELNLVENQGLFVILHHSLFYS